MVKKTVLFVEIIALIAAIIWYKITPNGELMVSGIVIFASILGSLFIPELEYEKLRNRITIKSGRNTFYKDENIGKEVGNKKVNIKSGRDTTYISKNKN